MNNQKPKRKDPLKHAPLPNPGDSLSQQFEEVLNDRVMVWIVMAAFGISYAMMEWIMWIANAPRIPILMTAFAVIMITLATWKVMRIRPLLRDMKLGIRGERAVGQFLERLRVLGYVVIHDIVESDDDGTKFNIDHVLIGPGGVFTIDTKMRSKPSTGRPVIHYDGVSVSVDGAPSDTAPITQALAAANRIRQIIEEMTGRTSVPVQPVVAFPGWFIEGTSSGKEVWVLEPKAIPKWLNFADRTLSEEDVALFANRLGLRARRH